MTTMSSSIRTSVCLAWLTALPVLFLFSFIVALLCGQNYALESACGSLLVSMGVTLVLLWRNRRTVTTNDWDASERQIVVCCCALLVWVAMTQVSNPRESGLARVGDTAMAVTLMLFVLLLRPDPRLFLRAMGASIACLTIVCVVVSGYYGKLTRDEGILYALGPVTILGCLALPILAAWAITLWQRRAAGERTPIGELMLCAMGLIALGVMTLMTERRGPVVALGAAAGLLACRYSWRRFPRLTLITVTLLAIAAAIWLVPRLLHDPGSGRNERYLLYRVAWAIGLEGFPFGQGPFGMLAATNSSAQESILWVARGKNAFHAHNELLNAWIEGGVIQVALAVALGVLMALRVVRCADPALKTAYLVLGTVWLVHAMTDNTYGIPLGMAVSGLFAGGVLSLPQSRSRDPRALSTAVLWLATGCGILSIAIGWPVFRMAALRDSTPIEIRLRALESCRDPLFVMAEEKTILSSPDADPPSKSLAIGIAIKRMGWTQGLSYAAMMSMEAERQRLPYLEAVVRLAQRNPFQLDMYPRLQQIVTTWPELKAAIPDHLLVRAAILQGSVGVMAGTKITGRNIAVAADCLAGIQRALNTRSVNIQHREQMLELVRHYGQCPPVAVLALQVCSLGSPDYSQQMLEQIDRITDGLGTSVAISRALDRVTTPTSAALVAPLVKRLCTPWIDRLELCQPPRFHSSDDLQERDCWCAVVRIWSLTRPAMHTERAK